MRDLQTIHLEEIRGGGCARVTSNIYACALAKASGGYVAREDDGQYVVRHCSPLVRRPDAPEVEAEEYTDGVRVIRGSESNEDEPIAWIGTPDEAAELEAAREAAEEYYPDRSLALTPGEWAEHEEGIEAARELARRHNMLREAARAGKVPIELGVTFFCPLRSEVTDETALMLARVLATLRKGYRVILEPPTAERVKGRAFYVIVQRWREDPE